MAKKKTSHIQNPITPNVYFEINKYGCCSAKELEKKYGIVSSYVSRAIQSKEIIGIMRKDPDGNIYIKTYLVKNEMLNTFIENHKLFDRESVKLQSIWKIQNSNMYDKLKRLRAEREINENKISKLLEIDVEKFLQYENGEIEMPISMLITLARYYQVSLDYLVGITDNPIGVDGIPWYTNI